MLEMKYVPYEIWNMFSLWNKLLRECYPHHKNVIDFQGLILVIAIAKCQRAKILTIRERRWICLEMSWNTVIDEKNIELNSIALKIVQT